jgi:hypothetical protein
VTHFEKLQQEIKALFALDRLQHSVVLILRAAWMGLAGTLLGWVFHALTARLPDPLTWISIGFALALIPISGILMALYPVLSDLAPPRRWIEALDRRLGRRQQFSTAWEIAQADQTSPSAVASGPVTDLLVQETLAMIPEARSQVLAGGWVRKLDVAAAVVAGLLSCALLFFLVSAPPSSETASPRFPVPQTAPHQPGNQPNAPGAGQSDEAGSEDEGGPGESEGEAGTDPGGSGQGAGEGDPAGTGEPGSGPAQEAGMDTAAAANALRELGQNLSRQAGTYDLGQALENLQLDQAAEDLQALGEEIKELSPESRENLAQAMEEAARDLAEANAPAQSENMQEAADSVQPGTNDPSTNSPGEALGDVADDLRQMQEALQASQGDGAGAGAGQGSSANAGQAEPVERLRGENGQMQLPLGDIEDTGLLSPAAPDAPGEGTASGSLDSGLAQDLPTGQSPLLPSSFLWKWRDVVSQYFQR